MKSFKTGVAVLLAGLTLTACGSDDSNSVPVIDNTAPVAVADTATAWVNTPVHIDVLANDTDAENDALTLYDFVITQGDDDVTQSGNNIVFTGKNVGTSIIEYTVVDTHGAKDCSTLTITVQAHAMEFVGSQTCIGCHTDKQRFFETGHNFKLNKVVDGKAPEMPFTNLEGSVELFNGVANSTNNSANPGDYEWTWSDISYVIGGYDAWANFIDKDGYILTGKHVAVSIPQNGEAIAEKHMQGFTSGPLTTPKEFDCGLCHSTGWKDFTPNSDLNPNRQDGMKGFGGTFDQAGIQCEACHGAGGQHIKTQSADDIVRIAEGRLAADLRQPDMGYGLAITCSECHTKQTNRFFVNDFVSEHNRDFCGDNATCDDTIGGRAINYFDGGRFAGDALLGLDANTGEPTGKKRNMACSNCHNPHASMNNRNEPGHEDALITTCTDCHAERGFDAGLEMHAEIDCTTCHMPSSKHLFRVNLAFPSDDIRNFSEANEATNTEEKQFVQPWNTAKDSCGSCHKTDYDTRAAAIVEKMHN